MAESAPTLIEFDNVSITLGGAPVLRGLSLRVHHGETKVLLGEAATGKSVSLKLAIGLMRPDSGSITVLGEPVNELPEEALFRLRRRIGMVFQESALFDSLTVRDNVAYRLDEEHDLSAEHVEARVRECLAAVELDDGVLDKLPDELSGGMRRRVAIARALATEPEIMLFDSPTAGLDPITATNIMVQIIRLRDVQRVTSLLVTHRLQDAALLAAYRWDPQRNALVEADGSSHTSFLVLHQHRAIFDGSGAELQSNSDPYIRTFLQA
jgi:phospholipid/cholesterol/gamma-HCH transport system ATP-binding protein